MVTVSVYVGGGGSEGGGVRHFVDAVSHGTMRRSWQLFLSEAMYFDSNAVARTPQITFTGWGARLGPFKHMRI